MAQGSPDIRALVACLSPEISMSVMFYKRVVNLVEYVVSMDEYKGMVELMLSSKDAKVAFVPTLLTPLFSTMQNTDAAGDKKTVDVALSPTEH